MIEIKWSPRALRDIKRLYDFIYEKNPEAAKSAASAIRIGIENLGSFPEIGKPIENLPTNFREINIPFGARGYIARYYLEEEVLVVLAIRHYLEVFL